VLVLVAACGGGGGGGRNVSEANVLVNQGLALQRQGKVAEARDVYRRALKADPRNKFALYNLGVLAADSGQVNQAAGNFENALRIDPDFVPALFSLAVLRSATAPQEAIKLYQRAIAIDPNRGTPHLNMGLLLRTLGQIAQGDAEIVIALRLEPALADKLPDNIRAQFTKSGR
jgi:tetratricopeptide (TPR) repeat protein